MTLLRLGVLSIAGLSGLTACLALVPATRPRTLAVFGSLFGDGGVAITTDVPYGPDPRQKLDIYRPTQGIPERRPIVLFLYGGSWSGGEKFLYGFVGKALASHGYTTVIPDYRLYPAVRFPAFYEDAASAYVYAQRTPSLADRRRPMIIIGHSAGAHMAAMLALSTTPRFP